jgi:RNA polymerase sigma factor (sigma-70 family)
MPLATGSESIPIQYPNNFYPCIKPENAMEPVNLATDNELVKLFQEGSNEAFEILVNRYKDKLFTSIKLLVKDVCLAEDLFQDTFIKIINTLRNNRYTEEGKFLTWAMRIAHNLCMDHFRRINSTRTIKTSDERDIYEVLKVTEPSPDSAMIQEQALHHARLILELLPKDQREVIVLRHFADLSFKEIAELTNCSINTALGRMRYGLMNLQKLMAEKHIGLQ